MHGDEAALDPVGGVRLAVLLVPLRGAVEALERDDPRAEAEVHGVLVDVEDRIAHRTIIATRPPGEAV